MPLKIMALIRNSSQCRSALIGIDRHWDQCRYFDWHWALTEGVLIIATVEPYELPP